VFGGIAFMITPMKNSDRKLFMGPAESFDAFATKGLWLGYYYFVSS
jgi:hypothetical protein